MAKTIEIRNAPDELYSDLKALASRTGMTISECLLAQVEQGMKPTLSEIGERLDAEEPLNVDESPVAIIRRYRDSEEC